MQFIKPFSKRTTADVEEYLQEPEKLIRENRILSLSGKTTVTTTFILPTREKLNRSERQQKQP